MRRLLLLLAGALLISVIVPGAVAAKRPETRAVTVPIEQTSAAGTVDGVFAISRFATQNGDLVALGTFTGSVTPVGGLPTVGSQALALPVALAGTCDILHLTLGPLDLNLLGLVVHLDRVVLDITAQQGPGNLLGNLLCAVAGLLDGGGPLAGLVALLNQILAILRL